MLIIAVLLMLNGDLGRSVDLPFKAPTILTGVWISKTFKDASMPCNYSERMPSPLVAVLPVPDPLAPNS